MLLVFCLTHAFSLEALAESSKPDNSFSPIPEDIQSLLTRDPVIRKSVIPFAPLQPLHDAWDYVDDQIKAETGLDLGVSLTAAFTQMTESLPGTEDHAFGSRERFGHLCKGCCYTCAKIEASFCFDPIVTVFPRILQGLQRGEGKQGLLGYGIWR